MIAARASHAVNVDGRHVSDACAPPCAAQAPNKARNCHIGPVLWCCVSCTRLHFLVVIQNLGVLTSALTLSCAWQPHAGNSRLFHRMPRVHQMRCNTVERAGLGGDGANPTHSRRRIEAVQTGIGPTLFSAPSAGRLRNPASPPACGSVCRIRPPRFWLAEPKWK